MRSVYASALTLVGLLIGGAASAIPVQPYGNFIAADFTFENVRETTAAGDPLQLFEAPAVSVPTNQLLFSPSAFTVTAAGAGGYADAQSQLQFDVAGNTASDYITKITIDEFGDAVLLGLGTASTFTFINMTLFVTVLEINGISAPQPTVSVIGTFTPGSSLALPGDFGSTLWQGTAVIDVAALYANVTKIRVALDNDLYVFSEAGTSAKLQKKVADGIVISVPEPASLVLLAMAGLMLGVRFRQS